MSAVAEIPTIRLEGDGRLDCGYCGVEAVGAELIETGPETYEFVVRCARCIDNECIDRQPDELLFTETGKPIFVLTPQQRNAIFAGDHTALKLEPGAPKPETDPGQTIVLARSRGGKQFLARSERERLERVEKGQPLLTQIPSKPTVWIVLKTALLKDGRWSIPFAAHDIREPTRTLAAAPTGHRQPGLKTRQRKRVPKKGETKSPKMSDDAARGYGGGGNSTVDEREGVDDATLNRKAQLAAEHSLGLRMKHRQAEKAAEREARAAEKRKGRLAAASASRPLAISDTAAPLKPSASVV